MLRPTRRIYRVRPLTSFVLCLPAVLIALWYTWNAWERFHAARRAEREHFPLTLETFQIQLHDLLDRDLRRITMGPPPSHSSLDVFTFQIDREDLDILEGGRRRASGREYASAKLEYGGEVQKVKLRLRGQRFWHMGADQKSLKVRLPKGKLVDGHRVFNVINDPSPMVVGEQLILDLAREQGILTPHSRFVRVRMNATDLGVFHYETQPDESLLRNSERVPGSIYSGDLTSNGDSWELWKSTKPWKKPASKTDDEATATDFSELSRLLSMVTQSTHAEFADFARHELDLERFARFDSIDVAFGGNRHNFRQNQKYAFDPYRGLWEPIAWSFEGFRDDPNFNLVEHPLLIRLKMVPEFLALRDRRLYELLIGDGSFSSLERRGVKTLAKLAPDLNTDPFWDAYHLLSRVDSFHRQMVRPMNMSRALLVFESEMTTYRQRTHQLLAELTKNPLFARWKTAPGPAGEGTAAAQATEPGGVEPRVQTELELFIDGRAGAALESVSLKVPEPCRELPARLLMGEKVLAVSQRSDSIELEQPLPLTPGVRLSEVEEPGGVNGNVRTELTPEHYQLRIESGCAPLGIVVSALHLATGTRLTGQAVPAELPGRIPTEHSRASDPMIFEPGLVAPHAWDLMTPDPERIELGPGVVEVDSTRVFEAHQSVDVLPGTRFKMRAKASLIFLGPVHFAGTQADPIIIERKDNGFWGSVALQGPATSGSKLSYVHASGGSTAHRRLVTYPAMISVHDTRDIGFDHCSFGENTGSGDVVHIAYVNDLSVTDSQIRDASQDGWDLEFTKGRLERVRVINAGDDAIDLMATKVAIVDSVLLGAKGNAVSAGEETRAKVQTSLLADAKVGVLAKNASRVELAGTVLFRNGTGVRIYERTVRYGGDSEVTADSSFAILTDKKIVKRDDKKYNRLTFGSIQAGFPPPGALDSVLYDIVGVESWQKLDAWVAAQQSGDVL